jgi:CheY-like chemotaxis protein
MSDGTVLLASSLATDRKLFTNFYNDKDVDYREVSNGIDALDVVIDQSDDLIFMAIDADLPVRDGLELVRLLKKSSSFSHIPLMLMVEKEDGETLEEAKKSWAEHVIERPINEPKLRKFYDELSLQEPLSEIEY